VSWYRYERSERREAVGGIRLESRKGAESWWAKRWIEVLEGFDLGARLSRGRSYARGGQVLSIDISPGVAKAKVQGSRPTPYAVTIKLKPFSPADRTKLGEVLGSQAVHAAKLMAGEMPHDIEPLLRDAGVPMFPIAETDLETDCSCPDWSNPCKHVAAVHYLLGQEFDRDPFLIFRLRGLTREDLIALLAVKAAVPAKAAKKVKIAEPAKSAEPVEAPASVPLDPDVDRFWRGRPLPSDLLGAVPASGGSSSVLRMLGPLPFWRGVRPLLEELEPVCASAGRQGLDVFVGSPQV